MTTLKCANEITLTITLTNSTYSNNQEIFNISDYADHALDKSLLIDFMQLKIRSTDTNSASMIADGMSAIMLVALLVSVLLIFSCMKSDKCVVWVN